MSFNNIMGNNKIKTMLTSAIQTDNVLHSYLFTGIEGIGKKLFAKEFAQMILCTSNDEKPCQKCKSCIEFQGESHPDLLIVEPEDGKSIKIEQIRYLQEKIAEKPVTSQKKVCIINDSDTMTREAANALLKTLEEPPSYMILILITSNESKLLVTIKSRCTKIAFMPLSKEELTTYLKHVNNSLESENKASRGMNVEMTEGMVMQCQGSIGKLLKIQDEQDTYNDLEQIINNLNKQDITQIWRTSEVLYSAKEKINDMLDYMNIVFFEKLKKEQDSKYTKAVSIVEETKKRIASNSNYDMTIDNLLLKLWEEFN